jgi:thymidylate synthase ThyX
MPNEISATIVADSIGIHDDRLTTIEAVIPRIVLAELNTHRMFNRNSASSRAIPAKRMREMVKANPFIPIKWMKEHTGMQGNQYLEDEILIGFRNDQWLMARDRMIEHAYQLSDNIRNPLFKGNPEIPDTAISKQIANRLLEPFMWHKVLISATDWENFLALRASEAAEIHFQDFAYKTLTALNSSSPRSLKPGKWHIPYEDRIDTEECKKLLTDADFTTFPSLEEALEMMKVKISVAMAARTSYTLVGVDGKVMTYAELIALHNRMVNQKPLHASVLEHVAQSMSAEEYIRWHRGYLRWSNSDYADEYLKMNLDGCGWCGTLKGWKQYRKFFPNENATDSRLIKHKYNSDAK